MEKKIKGVPKGYRLAKVGEKITEGMIFRDANGDGWTPAYADGCRFVDGPGAKVFGHIAYAIPVKTKPAKPTPKAKWAPYDPDLSIKETKRSLYLKLEEMVATINNLGAENARLKNQLAKGKAK